MGNRVYPQDLNSNIFSSSRPTVLDNPHLLVLTMVFLSLEPHASLSPFDLLCCDKVSFCCIFTIRPLRMSKHQLLMNTVYS